MTKQLPQEMKGEFYDLYCSLDGLFGKQLTEEEARPKFLERVEKYIGTYLYLPKQEDTTPIKKLEPLKGFMDRSTNAERDKINELVEAVNSLISKQG